MHIFQKNETKDAFCGISGQKTKKILEVCRQVG